MIYKTYKTRELKGLTLHLTIDGRFTPISFIRGCTLGSTATYTTSNLKEQEAIEANASFGSKYYLEKEERTGEDAIVIEEPKKVIELPKEEEKEIVDMLDAQTFKNLVELRNALQDKGIDVSQITNVKAAESIARKNGYDYKVDKNA